MASELALHPDRYREHDVKLIAAVDRREQAFYWSRLGDCAERSPALDVRLWTGEEKGTPTADGLSELIARDLDDRIVVLCGPDAMITALEEQSSRPAFRAGAFAGSARLGRRSVGGPPPRRCAGCASSRPRPSPCSPRSS
jgi:ferredoxin-NADP reductase